MRKRIGFFIESDGMKKGTQLECTTKGYGKPSNDMTNNTPNTTQGWLLTDPQRRYTPAAKTDVLKTFKRLGWTPPTEAKPMDVLTELNNLTIRGQRQ
jgi:hypothetical protein